LKDFLTGFTGWTGYFFRFRKKRENNHQPPAEELSILARRPAGAKKIMSILLILSKVF